jgi:membrane-associated phospholipid phosphatase
MTDLSRPWPFGLGEKRWWLTVLAVLVLLGVALLLDRQASVFAQGWPAPVRDALDQLTPYGESGWILFPAAGLYIITAAIALFVRWKLMRTMLWQFAALYAFIFVGVGLPSLFTTIVKRLIGRARPMHFDEVGLLSFKWNVADWTYQSFPSGHATTAFALAATVGFISERWFYPALALASAIALSRLTLGVHYPSDVLTGAVVGLVGAYAVRWWFAGRRWMFESAPNGQIRARPMSSLKRYLTLKRRGTVRAQLPNRP